MRTKTEIAPTRTPYAQEVKVSTNYRITIPKIIAEKIGLKVGDKVLVVYDERSRIIVIQFNSIKKLKGIIKNSKIKSTEIDNIIRNSESEIADTLIKEYKK